MNTPAAPISIATALSDQMSALLNAATKLDAPPISNHSAFLEVTGMEQDLESLYSGFADDANMPDLTAASQADLQTRLDGLKTAIDQSQYTSDLIVGAAQAVAAFSAATA
ncbi:hypothetical protein SAMN05446935_8394 [Burkholderia sp. YR290]|nr:hypothetical protein SAMN05446935_8394 [Burkholderia sp. YR290]